MTLDDIELSLRRRSRSVSCMEKIIVIVLSLICVAAYPIVGYSVFERCQLH